VATRVEEFAALLRELKDRSGHSYGTLGARLHVSTSTLHRYCNGSSVPQDYAPIERLARVCRATPEELVALHRLWILADGERSQSRDSGADPVPRAEAPEAAAAPAPEPRPAPAPAIEDPATEEPATEEPATEEPGTEAPTAEDPAADHAPAVELGQVGGRWRALPGAGAGKWQGRRRGVVVASVLAVIGIAGAAVPAMLRSGHHATLTVDTSAAGDATLPGKSPAPSATPSNQQPTATGSPSASVSAPDAGKGAAATPTASGHGTKAPSGGLPLAVNVLDNNWNDPCDWLYMGKQPHDTMPVPDMNEAPQTWANAVGAVHAGHLRFELTVQGTADQTVVLHSLAVHVVNRAPAPASWTAYDIGDGCGGGLQPAYYALDLDAATPQAKPTSGTQADGTKIPISSFPYQVSSTDPQVIDVDAAVSSHDVSWYLDLVWSSGDQQGTYRIGLHGRPFRAIGTKNAPHYIQHTGSKTWSPDDTAQ